MMEQSTISNPIAALLETSSDSDAEPSLPPVAMPLHQPAGFWERTMMLFGVVLPLGGLVAAAILLWGRGFRWVDLGLLLGMYIATTLGVTVGFHRLFTHRSFETTPIIKFVLAILGCMAVEGPMLKWVAVHRRHHQYSDDREDPHSPHFHGGGILGMLSGFWHAHAGWMFERSPADLPRYVGDLFRDTLLRRVSKTWFLWAALGLLIPAVLGGVITLTWAGVLFGFLWGGLARVFLVHHVTWSINSICHIWGSRPYESHDESRNNFVFGVLGMGEGWHNNHHAFPTSARHGLRWWQIDVSYWVIRALEVLGLAWKVRLPDPSRLMQKVASA